MGAGGKEGSPIAVGRVEKESRFGAELEYLSTIKFEFAGLSRHDRPAG
jgi:hypothetical protein